MVRAPRLGTVKRRLSRDIGTVAAWRFYRGETARLLRRLCVDRRWSSWLAVTPDSAIHSGGLWPFRGRLVGQGRGDLGWRLGSILKTLPAGPVVIVGSDIPEIERGHIARAFRELGRHEWILGPAPDGGYWLIGARRRPRTVVPFKGVRWSSRHALADTLKNIDGDRAAFLDMLSDVDDGESYRRWRLRAARISS